MDRLAFIDIETTGARAGSDRITEVAIRVVAGDEVLESWQSLVNPECSIPLFIQRLTGIDDAMVAHAPRFEDIADQIEAYTKDCVFVAHNARFDYAFIKAEFKRLGRGFARRVFCTVKLAKRLYPEHRGHGLDKLIARHNLPCSSRHRAMGDVEAMWAFYKFAEQDKGAETFSEACKQLLKRTSLPAGLDASHVNAIPEAPGVYHFCGEGGVLLYVGKSVNMYQRVLSHFSADHQSQKEMTLCQSVRTLKSYPCASELDALLLEIDHVKRFQPLHNRRLRPSQQYFTYVLHTSRQGYLKPVLREMDIASMQADDIQFEHCFGVYRTKGAAKKALQKWFQANELCARLMGQDITAGPCFARHLGRCKGACEGKENVELYNLRVNIALHKDRLKDWPYEQPVFLREQLDDSGITTVYLLDKWCVLKRIEAPDPAFAQDEASQLFDAQQWPEEDYRFDADVYRVLSRHLIRSGERVRGRSIIPLKAD